MCCAISWCYHRHCCYRQCCGCGVCNGNGNCSGNGNGNGNNNISATGNGSDCGSGKNHRRHHDYPAYHITVVYVSINASSLTCSYAQKCSYIRAVYKHIDSVRLHNVFGTVSLTQVLLHVCSCTSALNVCPFGLI